MRTQLLLSLLIATTALGCSEDDTPRPAGTGSNPGGSGGAGGSGGGGGSGGTGGVTAGPGWEGLAPALAWRYQGYGEVFALATGDFLGDGTTQVAVGGRRPLLLSADGASVVWAADWVQPADNHNVGGDNDWAYDLAAIPADGGRVNLLVTSSMGDAALLDGRDGTTIWRAVPEARYAFPFLTTFETEGGLAFLPRFGLAAHAVATGERLWELPVPAIPTFVQTAKRAGGHAGIVILDEGDMRVGGPGMGRPGLLASMTAEGELLYAFELPEGEQPSALGVADLGGTGDASALVATTGKPLRAYEPNGDLRWERDIVLFGTDPGRTYVSHLVGRDLDGDGTEEILVVARDGWAPEPARMPTMVVALEATGEQRWSVGFEGMVQQADIAEWGGEPVLLLAAGIPDLGARGAALAISLSEDAEDRVRFRTETPGEIRELALQGDTLVLGTTDGILRGVGLDGESRWMHHLSTFLYASAKVPVGDEDWVAVADSSANVALIDASGQRRWFARMAVGSFGWSIDVVAAQLGDTGPSVITAAKAEREGAVGVIERYSVAGRREGSIPLPSEPAALAAADLDGDGIDEILSLEQARAGETACHLRLYNPTLLDVWSTPIELCQYGEISVGAVDADGSLAIAVRTDPGMLLAPSTLSIVEVDGALRWKIDETEEYSLWARAVPGGLLAGGATTQRNGFVGLRSAESGDMTWKTLLPPKTDPAMPDGDSLPGASWWGTVLPGEGGEAFRIALSTYNNELVLVDAAGEIVWSVDTETEAYWPTFRRIGGPVAYVPGTDDVPPHLVTAQCADSRRRADSVTVAMDGTIVGRVPMHAEARRLHVLRRSDGSQVAAAQALLGVWATGPMPQDR